ncbi:ribosomal RNA processing protein 1 [Tanacetum coccineum]
MEVNPSTVSLPLIRNLASCNTPSRSKALRDVISWLPTQTQIPEQELLKLWKGLFYSMWHSDKTPVQHNLIEKISSLLLTLNVNSSLQYLSAFLVTLRREWSGIDVLRLDKFYLLIRRFVNYSFNLLKKNAWDVDLTKSVMSVYEEKTMLANEKKFLGNGVNYHIASVFLDEVKGYMPVGREVCEVLFKPFLAKDKSVPVLFPHGPTGIYYFILHLVSKLLRGYALCESAFSTSGWLLTSTNKTNSGVFRDVHVELKDPLRRSVSRIGFMAWMGGGQRRSHIVVVIELVCFIGGSQVGESVKGCDEPGDEWNGSGRGGFVTYSVRVKMQEKYYLQGNNMIRRFEGGYLMEIGVWIKGERQGLGRGGCVWEQTLRLVVYLCSVVVKVEGV